MQNRVIYLILIIGIMLGCSSMLPLSGTNLERSHYLYQDNEIILATLFRQFGTVGFGYDFLIVNKSDRLIDIDFDSHDLILISGGEGFTAKKESSRGYFPIFLKSGESINFVFLMPPGMNQNTPIDYQLFRLDRKEYKLQKRS